MVLMPIMATPPLFTNTRRETFMSLLPAEFDLVVVARPGPPGRGVSAPGYEILRV
jgi:hypothetical protein